MGVAHLLNDMINIFFGNFIVLHLMKSLLFCIHNSGAPEEVEEN